MAGEMAQQLKKKLAILAKNCGLVPSTNIQLSVTLISGNPMSSSDFFGQHTRCTYIHAGKAYT